MREKGFTLIELLVVVSILGVLLTFAVSQFLNLQQNGRDARKKTDIGIIQGILEQYHADQGYYPSELPFGEPLTNDPTGTGGAKVYLQALPTDTSGIEYGYVPSPQGCDNSEINKSCLGYRLCAKLENQAAPEKPACDNAESYNYEVTQGTIAGPSPAPAI